MHLKTAATGLLVLPVLVWLRTADDAVSKLSSVISKEDMAKYSLERSPQRKKKRASGQQGNMTIAITHEEEFRDGDDTNKACSCYSTLAPFRCCERVLFLPHKFGHMLFRSFYNDLIRPRQPQSPRNRIITRNRPQRPALHRENQTADYRHLIPIRNWYEAFVSGYLYHKVN